GLYLAYQRSSTFRAIVDGAFRIVKASAQAALGWITRTGLPDVRAAINAASPVIRVFAALVRTEFNLVKGYVSTVVNVVGDLLHGRWMAAWNDAKQGVANLVSGVRSKLAGIPGYLRTAAGAAASGAAAIGRGIMQGIAAGIDGLAGWLEGKI